MRHNRRWIWGVLGGLALLAVLAVAGAVIFRLGLAAGAARAGGQGLPGLGDGGWLHGWRMGLRGWGFFPGLRTGFFFFPFGLLKCLLVVGLLALVFGLLRGFGPRRYGYYPPQGQPPYGPPYGPPPPPPPAAAQPQPASPPAPQPPDAPPEE